MHVVPFDRLLKSRVIHSMRKMDSPATTQPMVFMLPSNTNQTLYPEKAATDYRVKLLSCMVVMMDVLTYTWLWGMASTQGLICLIAQHQVMPKVSYITCGLFLVVFFHACVGIKSSLDIGFSLMALLTFLLCCGLRRLSWWTGECMLTLTTRAFFGFVD